MVMPVTLFPDASGSGLGQGGLPGGNSRWVDLRRIGGTGTRFETAKQHCDREHDNEPVT